MDENEVGFFAKGLLVKIFVITGWSIPEDDLGVILNDQFRKKLLETYSTVNADEIEYAFRVYGAQVKDWGKFMNLSLIDEVMAPYLAQRSLVSKIEEQKFLTAEPVKEMTDQEMDVFIKSYKGQNTPLELLPEFAYQWLVDKQRIWSAWSDEATVNEAIAYRKSQISRGLESNPGDRTLVAKKIELKKMLADGVIEGPEMLRIQVLAKKIIIRDYLNALK